MIHEPKQELLVQYLLNEVDAATAEQTRAELETDAEVRDFLRETEDAFASMAHAAPPIPKPAVKMMKGEAASASTPVTARASAG